MKILSVALIFAFAILISNSASAANYEVIETVKDVVYSIDKDSIKKGTDSKKFPNFNRKDDYSAIIKVDIKSNDSDDFLMIYLVSFYEENGKKMFHFLDSVGEAEYPQREDSIKAESIESGGAVWTKIWNYVEKNAK